MLDAKHRLSFGCLKAVPCIEFSWFSSSYQEFHRKAEREREEGAHKRTKPDLCSQQVSCSKTRTSAMVSGPHCAATAATASVTNSFENKLIHFVEMMRQKGQKDAQTDSLTHFAYQAKQSSQLLAKSNVRDVGSNVTLAAITSRGIL